MKRFLGMVRLGIVCGIVGLLIQFVSPITLSAAPPAADRDPAPAGSTQPSLVGAGSGKLTSTKTTITNTSSPHPSSTTVKRTGVTPKRGNDTGKATSVGSQASSLQFYPLARPIRFLDTRPGFPAFFNPGAPEAGGFAFINPVRGITDPATNVTIPGSALAVTGNLTVVADRGAGPGYVTLYPSDAGLPATSNANYVDGQTVPNAFTVALGSDGGFLDYPLTTIDIILDITGYYAPVGAGGLYFHRLPAPLRYLDTRPGSVACATPGTPDIGGATYTGTIAGLGCTIGGQGIPSNATAIAGNATVVADQNAGPGFLTLFPGGTGLPAVSNNNYVNGQVVPNFFFVGLGGGQLNAFSLTTIDLVIDIAGYFSPSFSDVNGVGVLYNTLPYPIRMYDTRAGTVASGSACFGGFGGGFPTNGNFIIPGAGTINGTTIVCQGLTIPTNAVAVSGNATVVADLGTGPGFVTLWPARTARPTASNLNYVDGLVVPNFFIVGLNSTTSGSGNVYSNAFDTFNSTSVDQIFDLNGYFS